jgi:hypothetical protein
MQRLWPEQIVLLALLGWEFWGFSLVTGVLIVIGIAARAAQAIAQVRRWHQSRQPVPETTSLTSSHEQARTISVS